MLGYLSNAAKNGYVGTKGRAREQAKQGNKAAIATLKDEAIREKSIKDKVAVRDPSGGIGGDKGPGSQTIGTEDVDPTGGGTSKGTESPSVGTGVTTGPGFGTVSIESPGEQGDSDDSSSTDTGSVSEGGYGGIGATAKGGFIKKPKPKVKKMKRGGLASR